MNGTIRLQLEVKVEKLPFLELYFYGHVDLDAVLFLIFFIRHGGLIDLVGTVPGVVNSDHSVSVKNLYSETSFQFLDCELVHEREVLPVHEHVLVDGVVLLMIVHYIFFVPFLLELFHGCFVFH